ncbi:MAG TPA: glycosyltransferase family 4 protein [Candidatus Eisenbacteria bacterium]|nr:glycosyltransferase family 4 protein [Candidatus Eisenbacteria bacterium]
MTAPRSSGSEPLNILMAASVPRRREGGVAAIIYNLGRELENRGHLLSYVFKEDLFGGEKVSNRFNEIVFSHRLERFIARAPGRFSIVNLHAPSGLLYGFRRHWTGSRGLPPYVMTLHGLEERRVHVQSREEKKGRAWNFKLSNRLWHRFYTYPLYRGAIRTADGAHAYSRDVWNLLQLKYNLDADRSRYIPSGVEPRFFLPRRYEIRGPLKLLYAGTWLDQRGIFYLRDALATLAERIPGITMTFAGCHCPPEVVQDFFGPELAQTVIVHPTVPSGEMQALFASHDIFLFPSLMEGLPGVLLEAMASGMPVITAETCGMPDVVEDGYNGLLVPPADTHAIEEAVVRLASSDDLRRSLGQAAQQTMARYTWERSAGMLEDLFRHIILLEGKASA